MLMFSSISCQIEVLPFIDFCTMPCHCTPRHLASCLATAPHATLPLPPNTNSNEPVICIQSPPPPPPPTYGDSHGTAGLRCRTITPSDCPCSAVEVLGWYYWVTYPGEIFCCVGLAKSRVVMLPSVCPNRVGLIPGLWKVKSLSPPIPVGGGAVDTNDWSINDSLRVIKF